jgi:hypothetical protein
MPIITITFYSSKVIIAITCVCKKEEFESHMKSLDDIYKYTISRTFLRKYLNEKGYSKIAIINLKNTSMAAEKEFIFDWLYIGVITIPNLKELLNSLNDDFSHFIDVYSKPVKSL